MEAEHLSSHTNAFSVSYILVKSFIEFSQEFILLANDFF